MKIQDVLRGISQIYFVRSTATGILILVGVALFDLRTAVLMLFGSLVQSLTGLAVKRRAAVADGLFGFNGALVGAAAGVQLQNWWLGLAVTLVGATLCTPVHFLFEKLFALGALRKAALPVSTAPFCTVTGVLMTLLTPWLAQGGALSSGQGLMGVYVGLANNLAEVVLADGALTGVLIALGLFAGGGAVLGAFALWGSALSLLLAALIHGGLLPVSTGLFGYSAVLVSIVLGATFWNNRPLATRIIAATIGVLLTLGIQPLLALTPIPVYTWPFLLSMWIVMLVGARFTPASPKKP
ncbi:urea transporter [Rothia aerolata]|uniref:Urea transporter n=1 Tax=Rothia aerolata TaxID=1812262 RepID=A0A917IMA5_9MICC|nr:urea transporter [Rothia aerolata]GGH58704.1 urea transporter [Rothia aerolata]